MKRVMVLGSGYMGSGIAQVCAKNGCEVLLWDMTEELARKGKERIATGLETRVEKGKETREDVSALLGRIQVTADLSRVAEAELVIEVVVENMEVKKKVLNEIDQHCAEGTLIATNTSYLPITEMAQAVTQPERFLGIHFFGPVPAMKLVELVRGEKTSDEAVESAKGFVLSIGKTPVVVNRDSAGFIVNRINAAIRMEAYRCYVEGLASIEDIDTAMKLGLNHPMGPFELNDLSGLEIGLAGLDTLYKQTGEERWKVIDKVRELVAAGELGRKSGKGWYDYTTGIRTARTDL